MRRTFQWGLALGLLVLMAVECRGQSRVKSRTPRTPIATKISGLSAEWLGQGGEDRVNTGLCVGPDGFVDAKIVVRGLLKDVEIVGIVLKSTTGVQWHSGVNPDAFISSEVIRRGNDPTIGDLFIGYDKELKGVGLSLSVHYANAHVATTKLTAGKFDSKLAMPRPKLVDLPVVDLKAQWIGQDGRNQVGPGDVHVGLSGLPKTPIVAAALNDSSTGLWSVRRSDKLPFEAGRDPIPMALIPSADGSRADLHFPPFRNESGGLMTLRILFEDGRTVLTTFAGGVCDPALRSPEFPSKTLTEAKPGDDLHSLVAKGGTLHLASGRYRLNRPLILEKPITMTGEPGSILEFSQDGNSSPWPAAIKVHWGHTTLEGFAVRFATPIHWIAGLQGGPAVIGVTDNTDATPGDLKGGLMFRKLDLEGPPTASKWEETPRLLRLGHSICGTIEQNTLNGGSIEFEGGPWRVVGNRHVGTPLRTFTAAVISGHRTHDLVVQNNVARPATGPSTKTWRFLVMTVGGTDDLISDNEIVNVGPRDDDQVPGDNAPETIITESYSLHFEGKLSAVSPDGRIFSVSTLQGDAPFSGDAVAILSGPHAGEWRRIVQTIGPMTFLLDEPLPKGSADVFISIASGFTRETFRKNSIDNRGSMGVGAMVLGGNHFGLTVAENYVIGGRGGFKITAAPTEHPVHWGWSHAPLMGTRIEGNVFEDTVLGGVLCVDHSQYIKTNRGRVYASIVLKNNVAKWSPAFAVKVSEVGREKPSAFVLGDPGSHDVGEMLIVEEGNRSGNSRTMEMRVAAAKINGTQVKNRTIDLPATGSAKR